MSKTKTGEKGRALMSAIDWILVIVLVTLALTGATFGIYLVVRQLIS